jgi:hypothetical protein
MCLTHSILSDSRGLNDITIKATAFADSGYLKLPNPDFIDLDDADHARLSEEISLKGELAKLVLDYVMCTISESMRLTYGTPRSFTRAKRLLFRHYDRAQFADAKWDILTLVCDLSWRMLSVYFAATARNFAAYECTNCDHRTTMVLWLKRSRRLRGPPRRQF